MSRYTFNNYVCGTNLKLQTMDGKLSDRNIFLNKNPAVLQKCYQLPMWYLCKDNMCLNPNVRKCLTMNTVPTLCSNENL